MDVFATDRFDIGPAEIKSTYSPEQKLDTKNHTEVAVTFPDEAVPFFSFHYLKEKKLFSDCKCVKLN